MPEHTKLPWRVFTNPSGTKIVGVGGQDGEGILDAGFGVWAWNDPGGIANANFVVKACNAFPDLVKALEDARAAIASLSMDALGFASAPNGEQIHWPVRDELLHRIDGALGGVKGQSTP
jgi:hypothetical protein